MQVKEVMGWDEEEASWLALLRRGEKMQPTEPDARDPPLYPRNMARTSLKLRAQLPGAATCPRSTCPASVFSNLTWNPELSQNKFKSPKHSAKERTERRHKDWEKTPPALNKETLAAFMGAQVEGPEEPR